MNRNGEKEMGAETPAGEPERARAREIDRESEQESKRDRDRQRHPEKRRDTEKNPDPRSKAPHQIQGPAPICLRQLDDSDTEFRC